MKTIVIPDVHTRIEMSEQILRQEKTYDRAVWLGDYFDAKGSADTVHIARSTANWLKLSIENPKHVHLWGNHDVPYGFDNWAAWCPGFTEAKDDFVWKEMTRKHFDQMKFHHVEQGWLLSHSGLSPCWLPPLWKSALLDKVSEWLDMEAVKYRTQISSGKNHWFQHLGYRRGGYGVGGLLWCDSREFQPIEGVPQIFGHTPQRDYPVIVNLKGEHVNSVDFEERRNTSEGFDRPLSLSDGFNVGLDTISRFYGVIENGELTIKPVIQNENHRHD